MTIQIHRLVVVGFVSVYMSSMANAQTDSDLIDKLVEQWSTKQERASRIEVSWEADVTRPKGYYSQPIMKRVLGIEGEEDMPSEDVTLKEFGSLILDGDRMRFDHETWQWSTIQKKFVQTPFLSAFDGTEFRRLWTNGSPDTAHPDGSIQDTSVHRDANAFSLFPMRITFRANDDRYSQNPRLLVPTGRSMQIRGNRCLEFRNRALAGRSPSQFSHTYWVDPSREFVVVRFLLGKGDKLTRKADIDYAQHSELGWIPSTWALHSSITGDDLFQTKRGRLKQIIVHDRPLDNVFDLSFPDGSLISDEIRKETYIVKGDGNKRIVSKEEMKANLTYEQLRATGTDDLIPGATRRKMTVWLAIGGALIVVGLVCLLIYRRVRLNRQLGKE